MDFIIGTFLLMILKSETHCQAIAKRRGKKSEVISIEVSRDYIVKDA